jgi:hypothetical protein
VGTERAGFEDGLGTGRAFVNNGPFLWRPFFAEKLMVSLRDGRKLVGVLRSWDQFGESGFIVSVFPPVLAMQGYSRKDHKLRPGRQAGVAFGIFF